MGDSETADRGFMSDMAMNAMKSKISGGKSNQSPSGPLGNILSSVLGGGNSQSPSQSNKASGGVGGIVSSLLGGGQNASQSTEYFDH